MTFLFENIWFWAIISALIGYIGWFRFQNNGLIRPLAITGAIAILVLSLGILLVFGVPTDRQKIEQTIRGMGTALETNDTEAVIGYFAGDADKMRDQARFYMGAVAIEWTKVRDFKVVNINYYTSPPTAAVTFQATVNGRVRSEMPFTSLVRFTEVVLIKEDDGNWYVTDRCIFSYPGGNSENRFL